MSEPFISLLLSVINTWYTLTLQCIMSRASFAARMKISRFFFCSDVCECCVCSSALVALRLIKMKILSAHDTLVPIKYQSTNVSLFGRYLNCCVRRPFIQLTAKQKSMLIRKSIGRRRSKNNSNHFRARIMSSKWFCYAWSEANKHRFGWKEILWIAIILNRFLFDCRWIGSVYTKLKWALKEPVIIA